MGESGGDAWGDPSMGGISLSLLSLGTRGDPLEVPPLRRWERDEFEMLPILSRRDLWAESWEEILRRARRHTF